MHRHLFFCTLICISSLVFSTDIHIETSTKLHNVEPYFLSYAVDAYLLEENPKWLNFNFTSPRLRTLMKGLAPSLLRFGGSPADWTIFTQDQESQMHYNASGAQPTPSAFTKQDLDNMVSLTRDTGNRFLFDLDLQLRFGKQWDPSNAIAMMMYMKEKGYGENVDFELGNEPGAYNRPTQEKIDPSQVGDDFVMLVNTVRSFPNLNQSMIVGTDSVEIHKGSTGIQCLISAVTKAGKDMKAATFHHYYFRGDTAKVTDYIDPRQFSNLEESITEVKQALNMTSRPDIPIWIGETADSWHSGTPNVTDRFISGFLWLDKLGLSAREGVSVVMRQTLYGHNYGLLDLDLNPNPDYWLSLVFKTLVGLEVLNVTAEDRPDTTRVYAHCTGGAYAGKGWITLFALNVNTTTDDIVRLPQFAGKTAMAFYMTPPKDQDMLSMFIAVNGKTLTLVDDTFPKVTPQIIAADSIHLPPLSFGFFVLDEGKTNVCQK